MKINLAELTKSTDTFVNSLIEENKRLRAVVEAADKYDNGGSYPALRLALNKWRKVEANQPHESAESPGEGKQ